MAEIRCPTCNELFDPEQAGAMPFCSVRCKQIDLGRWLNEEHGIPIEPEDREDQQHRQPQQADDER